jgi:3-oxoacyl-[acyl-carrier protein] reductase
LINNGLLLCHLLGGDFVTIHNKVFIITGSGRGIGKQIALDAASQGAKVVVNDVDEQSAESVVGEITNLGGEAIYCIADISNKNGAEQLMETALNNFGTIDVLVNNAAVTRPAMIHKMTDEQWDLVLDIGLKGVFNCIRAVAPTFIQKGKENPEANSNGKIINVTSVAGLTGTIGQINYGAAKSGLVGMTMSVAREWGRYRIQSNAVAFGLVETPMTETIRNDEKFRKIYEEKIPLNRFARVEDVTPGVLFLASDAADYVTGHVLNISGGYFIG